MADTLEIFGTEYTGVTGIIATNDQSTDLTYIRPQGTKSITQNGTGIDVAEYASVDVNVSGGGQPSLQTKTKTYTPTESQQTETVTADNGYDGLSQVDITVNAISSTYVGSGITQRSSSDLTASGATVTVPSGYYASQATKAVSNATFGERGIDESYLTSSGQRKWRANPYFQISTAGYANSGYVEWTKDYNAIASNTSVTPSTSAQTIGGANYMMEGAVTVEAMPSGAAGTPTATKGTVSNHSISVTPSVTNTTGYITGSTKTGTAVTVSASELVSGSETKTANGTYDVTNLASLVVDIDFVTYYTGTSTPSSSLGSNGDIYLMTV